jgi:hypothetical protein
LSGAGTKEKTEKIYLGIRMIIINIIKIFTIILVFMVGIDELTAQSVLKKLDISYSNSFESKYISEGRNNLESGGLSSFNTDISIHWLNLNMWYGTSVDSDYRELQFSAGLSFFLSDIGINFGLTDLSNLHEESCDQEFYTEISYNKFNWLTPTIVNVYSFSSDGSFVELLLENKVAFQNQQLGLTLFLLGGLDFGYIENTNGLNNFQMGVKLSYQILDNVYFISYLASSFGVWEVLSNENHTWGGIRISTDF